MPREEPQKICPICGKEIAETEETAVCPDCSQKYHKACFSQSGGCVTPNCPGAKPAADTVQNTPETAPQNEPAAAPQSTPANCPKCGAAIAPGAAFCPSCGRPTEENPPQSTPANCPKCGAAITPGAAFCPSCGQKISEGKPKKKHKALVPILISGVLVLGVAAAAVFLIPFVKNVELSDENLTLMKGSSQSATCDVTVLNSAKAKVKWVSSDESIAKVDNSGKIEGVGDGTCVITASCGGKKDAMNVKVVVVNNIELRKDSMSLKQGETESADYVIHPAEASSASANWKSSDESVASVDSYGKITAVGKGNCTISVSAGEKTDSLSVTVSTGPDFNEIFTECGLDPSWAEVGIDGSYLSIDTNPTDMDDHIDYLAYFAVEQVNLKLGFSESTTQKMNTTSALDGRQSDTNASGDVMASWKYHPDHGLEVTYEIVS